VGVVSVISVIVSAVVFGRRDILAVRVAGLDLISGMYLFNCSIIICIMSKMVLDISREEAAAVRASKYVINLKLDAV